jgi:hypothetical protein
MDPEVRRRLLEIASAELEAPGTQSSPIDRIRELVPQEQRLLRLLEEHQRACLMLKARHLWYRTLGWRLVAPLMMLGLAAAVGFSLQRAVAPVLGVGLFLAGAASYYVILQLYAHRWAAREHRQLDSREAQYRDQLRALMEELGTQDADEPAKPVA